MSRRPSDPILFREAIIKQIARLIGATDSEFSNSKIERAFARSEIKEFNPPSDNQIKAKWRRIDDTLVEHQRRTNSGEVVVRFIEECLSPSNFTSRPDRFNYWCDSLNEILVFEGFCISKAGKIETGSKAQTLDEAARIAESMMAELKRRQIHRLVLAACDRELMQKNLFHGIQEATKSVFQRLRFSTQAQLDGADLVNYAFSTKNGMPVIAINKFTTQSEMSEHQGFANLLRGVYGMWRNPTVHDLRSASELQREMVIDAMTTLSYIHKRLDTAINTQTRVTVA